MKTILRATLVTLGVITSTLFSTSAWAGMVPTPKRTEEEKRETSRALAEAVLGPDQARAAGGTLSVEVIHDLALLSPSGVHAGSELIFYVIAGGVLLIIWLVKRISIALRPADPASVESPEPVVAPAPRSTPPREEEAPRPAARQIVEKPEPPRPLPECPPLLAAQKNSRFDVTLTLVGGRRGCGWTVVDGTPPPWFEIASSTGRMTGRVPQQPGESHFTFAVEAVDETGRKEIRVFVVEIE